MVAQSRLLDLWLVDPPPRRMVHARELQRVEELLESIAEELGVGRIFSDYLELVFSDVVLDSKAVLQDTGIDSVSPERRASAGWLNDYF